ncbi:MAG: M20 family metallopeptidase, partial [Actinobacteria bacterium]|nr:M20 family metallopeptidase [Actinomycetota bacterium]
MNLAAAKARIRATIEHRADDLLALSHDLWNNPELCFEEHHAHAALTAVLETSGFTVQRGAYGLPTAFRAVYG